MYRCKKLFVPLLSNILLLLSFWTLGTSAAKATHVMGGELTYECLGPNRYRLVLNVYRDCNGVDLGTSASVGYRAVGCAGITTNASITLNQVGTATDITPLCATAQSRCLGAAANRPYGVQRRQYVATLTLPSGCNNWVLDYSLAARNNAITTIANPGGMNMYIRTTINNTLTPCNSSPVFLNNPSAFTCRNQQTFYNHGAYDPDGDSLAFALVPCMNTSTAAVTYNTGFSATQPMGTGTTTFDPLTGAIGFNSPNQQVAVVCVRVDEFRNGVKIGEVVRDIQITVINCTNTIPVASGVNGATGGGTINYQANSCFNTRLCFDILGSDANTGNRVTMYWNGAIPGATFTTVGGNGLNPVRGRFCWTPTPADIGSHTFTVTVEDDACPLVGSNTFTYTVNVISNPNPPVNAGADVTICQGQSAQLTATSTATNIVRYIWTPTVGVSNPNIPNPRVSPTATTTYTVTAVYSDSCTSQDDVTVRVVSAPPVSITPNNVNACPADTH